MSPTIAEKKEWAYKKMAVIEEKYSKRELNTDFALLRAASMKQKDKELDRKIVEMYGRDILLCQYVILLGMYSIVEKDERMAEKNIPRSKICKEVRQMDFSPLRRAAFERYHCTLFNAHAKGISVEDLIAKKAKSMQLFVMFDLETKVPDILKEDPATLFPVTKR